MNITTFENGSVEVGGLILIPGSEYVIKPKNPRKLKHRNRICVFIKASDKHMPSTAEVRFKDTNRIGKIDLCDLVSLDKDI